MNPRSLWSLVAINISLVFLGLTATTAGQSVRGFEVDCDRGQSVRDALGRMDNNRSVTIRFRGTCTEDIVIDRDDITLNGVDESATIAGGIILDRVSRVTLRDLTLRDGVSPALLIRQSVGFLIDGLTVLDSPSDGILIESSAGTIHNLSVLRTGGSGLLTKASQIDLAGKIVANENGIAGIFATVGSTLSLNAAEVTTGQNGNGFVVQGSSAATFAGGSLEANNNLGVGIAAVNQAVITYAGIRVEANDNGLVGLLLSEFGSWLPGAGFGSEILVSGNGFSGAVVQEDSSFVVAGPGGTARLVDNLGPGIQIDGSKAILLDITMAGNAVFNLRATFGSRVTVASELIDAPVACDETVLNRGVKICLEMAANDSTRIVPELELPAKIAAAFRAVTSRRSASIP